jgi:hypothetical protein
VNPNIRKRVPCEYSVRQKMPRESPSLKRLQIPLERLKDAKALSKKTNITG